MQKQLSVSQLNSYVKGVFDDELILQNVSVFGEIFEFKVAGGNSYITLKEDNSILTCVYFSSMVEYPLGANVMANGAIRYYHKGGKLSFVISSMRIIGDGEIIASQRELRLRLEKEGLFDKSRQLKPVVESVALITSGEGAVLHDFLSILSVHGYLNVTVFCVNVQGEGASDDIVATLERIDSGFDVIVIARGGGSHLDLDEFNNEKLARAVFAAKIPVISAVGHETDWTLCDYVADHRAGTPSIAAEMILRNNERYFQGVVRVGESIRQKMAAMLAQKSRFLYGTAVQSAKKASQLVDFAYKKCGQYVYKNMASVDRLTLAGQATLKDRVARICSSIDLNLQRKQSEFRVLCATADTLSPMKILSQGYSRVVKEDECINSVSLVNENDDIRIIVADGEISARVKSSKRR